MISNLIEHGLKRPLVVITTALVISAAGVWAFFQQPIDAYPDISAEVVQVITVMPGRAAEEVERQVTIPIEISMRNVPNLETIRSRTIFGLSVVQLVFNEGTESYWARQRVLEKLETVELPEGASAELGPLATAYGEVYRYELRGDNSVDLMTLRELNDWVVIPRILRAQGVAEVSNFGGLAKQYSIKLSPSNLKRYGLTFDEVVSSIQQNNSSAGGSVMRRDGTSFVIRGTGAIETIEEIRSIFVRSVGGTAVYLKDVGDVTVDFATRTGIYSRDDRDDSVEGIVLMRRGENPSEVLASVKAAIDELNNGILPANVHVDPFYNRQNLVDSTLATVTHSVSLGITLVLLVLLLFLGRPSLAILIAITIPFSLLFAVFLMYLTEIPIGLLSIGAIDFGIIVDGAIIMGEHLAHQMAKDKITSPRRIILRATREMASPVFFSVVMVIVAYLPLLSLQRIEGLLFRPMALTMVFALIGALLFALFVVPVLFSIVYSRGFRELRNPVLEFITWLYGQLVRMLLAMRWIVIAGSILIFFFISLKILPRIGFEFLPYMDEGVIWVRANFPEGSALEQTSLYANEIREIVSEFEDIEFVSCQAGRNDSGTDPFPPSRLETMIGPKPIAEWKQFDTKQELIAALGDRLRNEFPTTRFNFTQPIIDSVTEDTNGTSANLAIEVSGDSAETLLQIAMQAVEVLKSTPGAVDVSIEQEGPQPQLVIAPDRVRCAQHNVAIQEVSKIINTAIGAEPVGILYEGERRFDIVAKFNAQLIRSPEALGRIPVFASDGRPVPLSDVASIRILDGQTIVARQDGKRRLTVRCDIVGRDQGSFVNDAQAKFSEAVKVPQGYSIAWLGMFENLSRAQSHFAFVMPITVLLIYVLLYAIFRSQKVALLLLSSVPLSFVGAALGLYVRGMNLNVSTAVGLAALFGVSIMNGVLMVRAIAAKQADGYDLYHSVVFGAKDCLRPILLASLVAVLGLLPASLAQGLGSDVQRPLATVIVWGLSSATLLGLFVVPVLFYMLNPVVALPGQTTSHSTESIASNEQTVV